MSLVHGRQERETDAVVLHPRGAFTIEQKDVRGRGPVVVRANQPVTVGGKPIEDGPRMRTQARQQSQMLGSVAKCDPEAQLGFVRAVLCFAGSVEVAIASEDELTGADVLATIPRSVCALIDLVAQRSESVVTLEAVTTVLERLHVRPPTRTQLRRAGFREA